MRKVLIALAAVAALAVLIPLDASARSGASYGGGGGGGWHGSGGVRGLSVGRSFGRGGFSHRGMRGLRASGFGKFGAAHGLRYRGGYLRHAHLRGFRWHSGRLAHGARFVAASPLLYAPYAYDFADWGWGFDYAYYDGCYELQPLLTPRGLIWQRAWVCY